MDTSDFRGVSIFRGQAVLFQDERRVVLDSVRGETNGWIPLVHFRPGDLGLHFSPLLFLQFNTLYK